MKEAVEQEKAKLPKILRVSLKREHAIAASMSYEPEEPKGIPAESNCIVPSRHLKSESNIRTNQDVGLDYNCSTVSFGDVCTVLLLFLIPVTVASK